MSNTKTLQEFLENNHKKSLIFDFDETIFRLHLPWEIFAQKVRQKLAEIDSELVANYFKREAGDTFKLMNDAIRKHGNRAKDIIDSWTEQFERDYIEKVTYNHELVNFIETEGEEYNLFVWSSNSSATVKRIIHNYNLMKYFSDIIGRDRANLTKPFPDGFFEIFDSQKDKHNDFLMIGDSTSDEKAAEAVGIDFLRMRMAD